MTQIMKTINPFVPNAPFLYPLKTSEIFMVLFLGLEKGCIGNRWVKWKLIYRNETKSVNKREDNAFQSESSKSEINYTSKPGRT